MLASNRPRREGVNYEGEASPPRLPHVPLHERVFGAAGPQGESPPPGGNSPSVPLSSPIDSTLGRGEGGGSPHRAGQSPSSDSDSNSSDCLLLRGGHRGATPSVLNPRAGRFQETVKRLLGIGQGDGGESGHGGEGEHERAGAKRLKREEPGSPPRARPRPNPPGALSPLTHNVSQQPHAIPSLGGDPQRDGAPYGGSPAASGSQPHERAEPAREAETDTGAPASD